MNYIHQEVSSNPTVQYKMADTHILLPFYLLLIKDRASTKKGSHNTPISKFEIPDSQERLWTPA